MNPLSAPSLFPLATPRLHLRELAPADWEALYALESDPEVARYSTAEGDGFTAEQARSHISDAERDRLIEPRRSFDLAIVLADGGAMIGRVGLRATWEEQREATIWFAVQRSHWGQGYATEAARALCDLGFRGLGLHRIFADCDARNLASARVLEKVGMRREAHFVESVFLDDVWRDSYTYAMLQREWPGA